MKGTTMKAQSKILSALIAGLVALAFAAPASAWQQSSAGGFMTDLSGFAGHNGVAGSTGSYTVSADTSTLRGNTGVENGGMIQTMTYGHGAGMVGGNVDSQGYASQGWHSSYSTTGSDASTTSVSHGSVTSFTSASSGGQAGAGTGGECCFILP